MKKRLLNILFWSIISAAFIGPGTITTAAKAGTSYGFSLAWALTFSVAACFVLQEAAARISIVSGKSLGRAIVAQFHNKKLGWLVFLLVIGAIIIGSAAYETGNLIGAASGVGIIGSSSAVFWVILIAIVAGLALLFPRLQLLARILGFLVVLMGVVFLVTAFMVKPDTSEVLNGLLVPRFPGGSGMLILGLIGTTVVPYNLFLGSGIADKKQTVSEMRFGIASAVILGGIVTFAVLAVGSAVSGEFTFLALANVLASKVGEWAIWFFGIGLFAAGFSSAITAPLASALTAKDLFQKNEDPAWNKNGRYFIFTWIFVLLTGVVFGTIGLKPIPAIIAAQALNGLILPFISIFLWFAVNNTKLMGAEGVNKFVADLIFGLIVWVTIILGARNLIVAFQSSFGIENRQENLALIFTTIVAFLFTAFLFTRIQKLKNITDK
jgi:Mn2+/Fe2+ NRAMP family transporter